MNQGPISSFLKHHFRHFNAASVIDASEGYVRHLENGGKMFFTLAGAMAAIGRENRGLRFEDA